MHSRHRLRGTLLKAPPEERQKTIEYTESFHQKQSPDKRHLKTERCHICVDCGKEAFENDAGNAKHRQGVYFSHAQMTCNITHFLNRCLPNQCTAFERTEQNVWKTTERSRI